jgi:ABC-type Zn uptake system ZnuABC Zn-binding protein ZnuA
MIKKIVIIVSVMLAGCATRPERVYTPVNMNNFIANCRQAKSQIDFLQQEIDSYLAYHRTVPVTLEDQRYFGKLKNTIWSLRSTCDPRYL